MQVHATLPNSSGEQLWLVHLMGSYYDNDPRGGGTNPVDGRFWVIARSHQAALRKAQEKVDALISHHKLKASDTQIVAQPFPLEILLPARDSRHDGRLGFHSTSRTAKVELTLPEDQKRYRLAVCLIEYDDSELRD
jgi:hypothetical protein